MTVLVITNHFNGLIQVFLNVYILGCFCIFKWLSSHGCKKCQPPPRFCAKTATFLSSYSSPQVVKYEYGPLLMRIGAGDDVSKRGEREREQ